MRFKPKARFEGGGISGVCRIIQATENQIATTFGTFNLRAGRWVWEVNYAVRLFPLPKEQADSSPAIPHDVARQ